MTRYINTRRYLHSSWKSNALNLLLSPPCFASSSRVESKSRFSVIFTLPSLKAQVFEYHRLHHGMEPLSLSNRYETRCVIIVSQESISGADLHPAHAFLSTHARTCGGYPADHSTVTCAIPCVLPLVQYIRWGSGYKPLVFDACRRLSTCTPKPRKTKPTYKKSRTY